jgi:uncharacterized membrane protein YhaH (DUF805 family)
MPSAGTVQPESTDWGSTMDWGYLFTSFEGRINRGKFWAGYVVLWIGTGIVVGILSAVLGDSASFWVLYTIAVVLIVLASLALQVKRWHDRGKSGWWVLINLVPIIGFFWSLIEVGFLPGTPGPNEFGPDPLAGA